MENVKEKKITKKEGFTMLLEVIDKSGHEMAEDLKKMVENEIAILERKATTKTKADLEKAKQNAEMADTIYNILAEDGIAKSATELLKEVVEIYEGINVQKVTHILTGLLADNKAKRETLKGKSYYTAI